MICLNSIIELIGRIAPAHEGLENGEENVAILRHAALLADNLGVDPHERVFRSLSYNGSMEKRYCVPRVAPGTRHELADRIMAGVGDQGWFKACRQGAAVLRPSDC